MNYVRNPFTMELLLTSTHFVIKNEDCMLCCDKNSGLGKLVPVKYSNDFGFEGNIACFGFIYGFIGKVRFFSDGCWYLILITKQSRVSDAFDPQIFRIDKVALIPLTNQVSLNLLDFDLPPKVKRSDLQSMLNDFIKKDNLSNINFTPVSHDPKLHHNARSAIHRESSRRGKLEARLCDAFLRMFCESNFYYSPDYDLTNCLQRSFHHGSNKILWRNLDDRFFWNKELLKELFQYEEELSSPWILPVIQGFYGTECLYLDLNALPSLLAGNVHEHIKNVENINFYSNVAEEQQIKDFDIIVDLDSFKPNIVSGLSKASRIFYLTLISRRSRYRAGTRYKRRGVDNQGYVANFVESELIITAGTQKISFVQVRGSIPIFWSQSGHKYRPLPLLTKDFHSNKEALELHITDQLELYHQISIINLVNEIGRESIVKNAFELYLSNIQQHNIHYIYFDYNKQCRGFHLLKLKNLLFQIKDYIENYKFFWSNFENLQNIDLLCEQTGVFRVNCMDCLDRTNVVQTTIASQILDIALMKLGLLMPDQSLPSSCLQAYRRLWANNGDAISRQYAGTAALKGDLTRTGHRNLKGTVRDGLSSANRYYINNFKDSLRQSVIESMQDDFSSNCIKDNSPTWNEANIEGDVTNNHNRLISAIKDYLELDESVSGWALKEPDGYKCISTASADQLCILLLLDFGILVILYDNYTDEIVSYEYIELTSIEKIQFGVLSKFKLLEGKHAIRIHYVQNEKTGYHYTFCSLFLKPDEIKLELNVINNELKFQTSILNLFPIFVSVKISSQPSITHNIIEFSYDSAVGGGSFIELKLMINEKSKEFSNVKQNDANILTRDINFRVPSSSIEDLTSNDYSNTLTFEPFDQSKGKVDLCFTDPDLDCIKEQLSFSVRKSLSDDSIYSHSSNTDIM